MSLEFRKMAVMIISLAASIGYSYDHRNFLHDLVSSPTQKFEPVMGYQVLVFPTPERLRQLPPSIRLRPELAALSLHHSLKRPERYDKGILERRGRQSLVFLAPRKEVPHVDRLYWVMMKVLSKEFSCFMIGKVRKQQQMTARCKDGRGVAMTTYTGKRWIGFDAKRISPYQVKTLFPRYSKDLNGKHVQNLWLADRRRIKKNKKK